MTRTTTMLRTNDTVLVLTGNSAGKKGKITQVLPKEGTAVVEGVNQRTKHVRSKRAQQKGEQIHYFAPVHLSNLMLVCPSCQKAMRPRSAKSGDVRKRQCRKCNAFLD